MEKTDGGKEITVTDVSTIRILIQENHELALGIKNRAESLHLAVQGPEKKEKEKEDAKAPSSIGLEFGEALRDISSILRDANNALIGFNG